MEPRQASRTARGAALHRAAHQTLEGGAIFRDPFACAILGLTPQEAVAQENAQENAGDGAPDARRRMRLFICARARFAEDALARAVARGVRQAVVLGAGLDTLALRNPHAQAGLRIFEVDHPDTQAWKRESLIGMAGQLPETLTFAPVDFERDELGAGLAAAGFDAGSPAFFVWLGVTPYLTREAVLATLGFIAGVPGGEVAFDYTEGHARLDGEGRAFHAALAARVAAVGEPLIGALETDDLEAQLSALGFDELENLDIPHIAERYFGVPRGAGLSVRGGHLMRARRTG